MESPLKTHSFWNTLRRDALRLNPGRAGGWVLVAGLFNPRFHSVLLYRLSTLFRRPPLRPIGLVLAYLNLVLYNVEIALDTVIGPGLFIPHGNAIISAFRIGENFTIFSGVVIGTRTGNIHCPTAPVGRDRPQIGSNVTVYSNAVVVGPIEIGDGARIGACVLVMESIPPGAKIVPAAPQRL